MMSGTVVIEGDASQYAGATGRGGLLVIKGNAASRCGISMKGIDIVVHGSIGHMSAFMAQSGNLVVLGDAGDALGDSLYEARLFVRGAVKSLGADCIEKEMRPEHLEILAGPAREGRRDGRQAGGIQALRLGAQALQFQHRQRRRVLRREHELPQPPDPAASSPRPSTITRWPRSAARRRPASMTSAAAAPSARYRISTTCCSSAPRSRAIRSKAIARNATPPSSSAPASPRSRSCCKIPITIAGMSFGALSGTAKEALGRGATLAGTSTTTGDGGMTDEERGHSQTLVYQYLPSRYGMNPRDLRRADAIEVVVGQGAKPGGGGMLLGQKISDRVAEMRTLPKGIDQRSACRHPDWTGPDDLEIKILELREITDWEKPIYVKVGGARPYYDTALAVKAGADVVVLDGMQGGTAATQDVFIENVGMPTLACIRPAVQALQDLGMHRKVQLIVSGGIRSGADVAKALALGADAVAIGTAALVALGDNDPRWEDEYQKLGTTAGAYDDWHEGRDPAGITTQDPELAKRLDPVAGRAAACQLPQGDDAGGPDHRARLRQQPPAQPRARGPLRADASRRRRWRRCRWPAPTGTRARPASDAAEPARAGRTCRPFKSPATRHADRE